MGGESCRIFVDMWESRRVTRNTFFRASVQIVDSPGLDEVTLTRKFGNEECVLFQACDLVGSAEAGSVAFA